MKKSNHVHRVLSLILSLCMLLILLVIPFTASASEMDEEVCQIYSDFCYAVQRFSMDEHEIMIRENHYFEIGEKVPDDVAFYYGPRKHIYSEKRYPEYSSTEYPGYIYYVPYEIVAQLLEEDFVNYNDPKSYLIESRKYDPATDTVLVGDDTFASAGENIPVAVYSDGEYTYVDGMILVRNERWAETVYGTYPFRGQEYFIAQKNQLVLKKVGDSYKIVAFRQRDDLSSPKTGDYPLLPACGLLAGSAVCLALLISVPAWKKRGA